MVLERGFFMEVLQKYLKLLKNNDLLHMFTTSETLAQISCLTEFNLIANSVILDWCTPEHADMLLLTSYHFLLLPPTCEVSRSECSGENQCRVTEFAVSITYVSGVNKTFFSYLISLVVLYPTKSKIILIK